MKNTQSISNIKTVEDACNLLGTTMEKEFPESVKSQFTDDELAFRELKLIARALNQEDGTPWEPDWSNWDENKYYPWMRVDTSDGNVAGSGFSDYAYYCGGAVTGVGSRLCFKSSDLAMYAGRQFSDIYKRFWLISK